jgi:geranylgeranyl diphosphate synthase type II
MDNDDFRRGKPSCHKAFDEYTAILAGDALNTFAFQILADDKDISDTIKVKLISELSKAAGFLGMIGGQQMDLELENTDNVSIEELSVMCLAKTGALIQCACRLGAITAHAPQYLVDKASEYGMYIGLAFQIVDDLLDVESTTDVLGKPVNSDIEENKSTFVTILGIQESKKKARYYTEKALSILDVFPDNEFMKEYTKELLNRIN